ncbi:dTMP kinase [Liquorilactobacillus satsumensis]|uniref:dTMP kinase n=1 Tax=Liquorilactobacillus satsumensis TaxID=259059 RepID=UPI001E60E992|nr:dTMP kinase [Liquorilactobacillus satsumensis]MCC7665791.1 dTMP kinase [Liquorilactobacillus satsumensis]MCP9356414.1 dTMP kinase [Liquorilactobacillus satsumensis]MCP9370447.1 dTMP kinase [Liquorilactobacillus satsumensis]
MAGKFITFEGPDGSGKTSVLKEIAARLTQKGTIEYLLTREPGGNRIAEKIRGIILDKQLGEMDARTEALLYAAARRQHLVETVLPALKADKLVLCDRYVDSSIVYQGAGRGLGEAAVAHMNEFATNGLLPELTLYFDVSPEIGLKRIARFRSNEVNRLDKESLTFHETVHAAYLRMAKAEKRIVTIDASQPFKNVVSAALQQLNKALPGLFD